MTLAALGGPARSQSKCQTSKAPSLSHSKDECPCTADGNAGWVPTIVQSPTKISNCLSGLVGCGGRSARSFMFVNTFSVVHPVRSLACRSPLSRQGDGQGVRTPNRALATTYLKPRHLI